MRERGGDPAPFVCQVFTFALPSHAECCAKDGKAARAAFYASWLYEALPSWPMFRSVKELASFMPACPVCGLGTGNFCDGCCSPLYTGCEEDGMPCPTCLAACE